MFRDWWGRPKHGSRGVGMAFLAMLAVCLGGVAFTDWVARALRFQTGPWAAAATIAAMFWIVAAFSLRKRRLRARLTAAGGQLCTECGYSLVGLAERGACPECGVAYEMEQVRAAWAAWK